jgi:hypothetical protein
MCQDAIQIKTIIMLIFVYMTVCQVKCDTSCVMLFSNSILHEDSLMGYFYLDHVPSSVEL